MSDLEIAIKALKDLRPGDTYIYFEGFLDSERLENPSGRAVKLADCAYSLMKEGAIHLTQRRKSPPFLHSGAIDWSRGSGTGFIYIATGAYPAKPRVFLPRITGGQWHE